MSIAKQSVNQEALEQQWQERCKQGNFSPAVLGVGTVRVFGKSGDAPVTFPRIDSLTALNTLAADEQWALSVAQEIVAAAQAKHRPVMATQPPQAGTIPTPVSIRSFDPSLEHILILSLTRGG
ncbi:MAG: hypothetical protein JOZ18_19650 [Chloroflexi bacterium]|nr:hypothetical protein [Chloroflexota bacterium]